MTRKVLMKITQRRAIISNNDIEKATQNAWFSNFSSHLKMRPIEKARRGSIEFLLGPAEFTLSFFGAS